VALRSSGEFWVFMNHASTVTKVVDCLCALHCAADNGIAVVRLHPNDAICCLANSKSILENVGVKFITQFFD
jgi:hypothetical protein